MSQQMLPTYQGYIVSNEDALLVIQAALDKKFPLVQRRPMDRERADLIRSGNVFVFIEESSEIKRWTDGVAWSASRILGRFLIYRKLDKASLNNKEDKRRSPRQGEAGPGSVRRKSANSLSSDIEPPFKPEPLSLSSTYSGQDSSESFSPVSQYQPPRKSSISGPAQQMSSRDMHTSAPLPVSQDRGLIKKTLSLSVPLDDDANDDAKQTIHLISYYTAYDVLAGHLVRPSHTDLKNVPIRPSLWQAMKRTSIGSKLPMESEANFFLDSNYQLQNIMSLAPKQPFKEFSRFSSIGSAPSELAGQTVSPEVPDPQMYYQSGNASGYPHMYFKSGYDYYQPNFGASEPPNKRNKSVSSEGSARAQPPFESSAAHDLSYPRLGSQNKSLDFMQSYSPHFSQNPQFSPEGRQSRSEPSIYGHPVSSNDSNYLTADFYRGSPASVPPSYFGDDVHGGYEQYSATSIPTLNNSAFGLQVSQQTEQQFHDIPNHVLHQPHHSPLANHQQLNTISYHKPDVYSQPAFGKPNFSGEDNDQQEGYSR